MAPRPFLVSGGSEDPPERWRAPNYAVAMASMFYDDVVAGIQKMFSVGAILSSPVIANRTIYVGSADGYLYAIN